MKTYVLYWLLIFANSAAAQILYLDEISFEDGIHGINIDTQANNIWQVGSPAKPFFNASYSLPNAIVTDTLNSYQTNNTSSFTFYAVLGAPNTLGFWHKLDTETGHAGGFIEDSIAGHEWTNLVLDNVLTDQYGFWTYSNNFYFPPDTIIGNRPAFTGTFDWTYSEFHWDIFCVGPRLTLFPDTIWFRFTFISDSLSTERDGWMIDDIRFQADICSGIKMPDPFHLSIYPNPAHGEINIVCDQEINHGEINIFNMSGQKILVESFNGQFKTISAELGSGIYFIQVTSAEGTMTAKVFFE